MFYELNNPRDGIASASINVVGGKAYLFVEYMSGLKSDDGYPHKTLIAAKIYYTTHYQSKKYKHAKPIWEQVIIEK